MRILPFAGTRYATAEGNPGPLAAPPFDQIDAGLRSRLHREPHQFAQLTRPDPAGEPDPPRHAAALHQQWLDEGITRRDAEESFYPYEILLAGGGRRLGLAALVGLEPPESGIVIPHEQTVAKTVAERLTLLSTTGCDLEPILLLTDDGGDLDRELTAALEGGEPLVEHRDALGHRHRLYRQDAAAGYPALLAGRTAVIADGNHRWQVARDYAARMGAAGDGAADAGPAVAPHGAKLAVVTSLESPGVSIDPIHRGLAAAPRLEAGAELLAERAPWPGEDGAAFAAAVAAAPPPALGVLSGAGAAEIWRLGDSGLAPERAALVPFRLHDELLPRLGVPTAAATDGTVIYRSDPDRLWSEVSEGELGLGLFLPPMSPPAFGAALAGGGLMPPKSTRFLPKLVSGLVWFDHLAR